jgi:hypothetical protein
MSKKLSSWQRERVGILHTAFSALAASMQTEGTPLVASLEALQLRLDGQALGDGKHHLRASVKTLVRLWYQWDKGGRKGPALVHQHASPKHVHMLPDRLVAEVQRLASVESGGTDKHQNGVECAAIHKQLARRWFDGEKLPGIGTWQEWWSARHPTLPHPTIIPDFPWCARTIARASGCKALKRWGNIGRAAANKHLPSMDRDYSKLRRCEFYTLDDVRLDVAAIDEITGRVVEVMAYVLMELSSRCIVAFVVKPVDAIKAEDVDELLGHGLQADGYGVGVGYQTHIWFERGTVACSTRAQHVLETFSDGAIKIHRTSMDGGVRWVGAAADRASGHSAGKAALESFNRNLHRRLRHLPGQRGNNFSNQPANLGVGERSAKDPSKSERRTLKAEAERIAQFKLTAMAAGADARVKLPLCTCSEIHRHVAAAVTAHNIERGHSMQGFHRVREAEIAPGVWREVDSY